MHSTLALNDYHNCQPVNTVEVQQLSEDGFPPFAIHLLEKWKPQLLSCDKPHRHLYCKALWVTKGKGICNIDITEYQIIDNGFYYIPKCHIHFFQSSERLSGHILSFNLEFTYFESKINSTGLYMERLNEISGMLMIGKQEEAEQIKIILDLLKKEFDISLLIRPDILQGWLKILLIFIRTLKGSVVSKENQLKSIELVNRFYISLEKNFYKKRMVVDYAGELSITLNYLNAIVKNVSGYPASHHIQQRIILEAKRHAMYSKASMKEITFLLGFCNRSYFSKFFKAFSGINFKAFKKQINCASLEVAVTGNNLRITLFSQNSFLPICIMSVAR